MVEIESSHKRDLPPVSIIIVTYNGSRYIKNLLDSLHDQSYTPGKIEIIVVDNASSDYTVDIIKKYYPSVKLFTLSQNIGFAAGSNYALQHAKSNFIAFLNQDTICHKNWLIGLVNAMLNDTELGACTSNMIFIPPDSNNIPDRHNPARTLCRYDLNSFGYAYYMCNTNNNIIQTKIISGCSFIITGEIIQKLGCLFDEDLWMYVEDTDLSLRIHNLGYKTAAVKESVIYHLHKNDHSINKNRISIASKALKNRVYVFYKNMTSLEFILFYPLLLIGGIFKIFNFHIPLIKKMIYFLPFSLFSIYCMISATLKLHKYKIKKYAILKKRQHGKFHILKLLLSKTL